VAQVVLSQVLEPAADIVPVDVAKLVMGVPFREDGLCLEHVERLVVAAGEWPPIVVSRADHVVIDGAHRVAAARRLGFVKIDAMLFDGSPEEAFVEFVRRNVTHGLLLTLSERKRAARRVLRSHPAWSDRRVAEVCGLSPKTVGRLRVERGCPSEGGPQLDGPVRIGRDDRARPVSRASVRPRVVAALHAEPNASLRAIAAVAGVSPETVRLVRMNLRGEPSAEAPITERAPRGATTAAEAAAWRTDAALRTAECGEDFLAWFEHTAVEDDDVARVQMVPLSRVYEIADEARRRSEAWLQFARALEARSANAAK
jgi:ParB-like chromosome segregation protein Spo0J